MSFLVSDLAKDEERDFRVELRLFPVAQQRTWRINVHFSVHALVTMRWDEFVHSHIETRLMIIRAAFAKLITHVNPAGMNFPELA